MKKLFFLTIIFTNTFLFSQSTKHTTDVFSFKLGLIGSWVGYEKSLGNDFTIESEIGYLGGFYKRNNKSFKYIFTSEISVEPRYYYNFNRRIEKNKNITKNAANFVGFDINFVPDFLTSTNGDSVTIDESINLLPKWGLKRQLSDKIGFEFALGLGYSINFEKNNNDLLTGLDLKFSLN